ncbi:MAG TPA: GAF domain-containing protein [Ktedonobacterales bacterium]
MLNVYRPIPRDLFSATPPARNRRALRFFTTWYEAIAGVIILSIMTLLITPVVARAPWMLLWPVAYLAYIGAMIALSRAPVFRKSVRGAANALSNRITWLIYGPREMPSIAEDEASDVRNLRWFHIALAVALTAAAFLFVVTLDRAYLTEGLPLSADIASWLLFVLPMLRVARYASVVWIVVLGSLVICCDGAAQLLAVSGADVATLRVLALHACWLSLISLLPAITLRSLSERRTDLASAIQVVRAITALQPSSEEQFANEAAALIAQRMSYDEVNVLLATSEDENIGRGLRFIGASSLAGRALVERRYVVEQARGITGWAAVYGQERLVNDVERDPDSLYLRHPSFANTKAELALPLILGDSIIGVLDVQSERANTFGEDDIELLRAIALHLALSLDNAQRLTRARGLAAVTQRIARRLLSQQDLRAALAQVVNTTLETLRADSVTLYPHNPDNGEIGEPVLVGRFTTSPASAARVAARGDASAVARALRDGQPRYRNYARERDSETHRAYDFVARDGVQSSAILPLRVGSSATETTALGVIFVNYHTSQRFSTEYREWCAALADLAALALQSAMLYQQVVEDERTNTWIELHDGMGQDVSYGRMLLEQVIATWQSEGALAPIDGEKLANAHKFISALQRQVNYLIEVWRERDTSELWRAGPGPDSAPAGSLFADLEEHAVLVQRTLEMKCVVRRYGDDSALASALRHDARMIAREAVYNAYRHGRAQEVSIEAQVDAAELRLVIRDNGFGFDTQRISTKAHGMTSIQRRAERHNGVFTLDSSRTKGASGTTVQVTFRLQPHASSNHTGHGVPDDVVAQHAAQATFTTISEGRRHGAAS